MHLLVVRLRQIALRLIESAGVERKRNEWRRWMFFVLYH
jgi:hypothetical protein